MRTRPFLGALVLVLVLWGLAIAHASPEIAPLRTRAHFSVQSGTTHWSAPVKSPNETTVYLLELEPDFDVAHHVVDVELVLRGADKNGAASNLLDPTGHRHGLQAYDFAAADLAKGAQASAYGEKRTITLEKLGLVVSIVVAKAVVSPVSTSDYQLDELDLDITVDNRKR